MAAAPAVPALADAAILLFYLVMWGVTLGLLYSWNATFHHLFQGIANVLNYDKRLPGLPDIHIHFGGWALTIDHAAQELFADAALGCEEMVGLFWHSLAWMWRETVREISGAAAATEALGKWMHDSYIPSRIRADLSPLRNKTNKAAAAAAAAGLGLAALKHESRTQHHAQAQTNEVARAHTTHNEKVASHAKAVATATHTEIVHERTVITQVIDVASLPVPFGRTVTNIRRRLGRVEALTGATAMAIAMANVFGVPNPRCLSRGPFGRFARALCGVPSSFFNDILGLLADFFILENICTVLPWIETAASDIGTPLVEALSEVGAGLCKGSKRPGALRGPTPSVPALIFGVSAAGV